LFLNSKSIRNEEPAGGGREETPRSIVANPVPFSKNRLPSKSGAADSITAAIFLQQRNISNSNVTFNSSDEDQESGIISIGNLSSQTVNLVFGVKSRKENSDSVAANSTENPTEITTTTEEPTLFSRWTLFWEFILNWLSTMLTRNQYSLPIVCLGSTAIGMMVLLAVVVCCAEARRKRGTAKSSIYARFNGAGNATPSSSTLLDSIRNLSLAAASSSTLTSMFNEGRQRTVVIRQIRSLSDGRVITNEAGSSELRKQTEIKLCDVQKSENT
jgi:hypothetical protein